MARRLRRTANGATHPDSRIRSGTARGRVLAVAQVPLPPQAEASPQPAARPRRDRDRDRDRATTRPRPREASTEHARDRRLLRNLVDPDPQGDRDLRGRPAAGARRAARRAQAAGSLSEPLRPQPRRPLWRAAAACRHPQAAHQGAVPPDHLDRLPVRGRAADLDPHGCRGVRDHPLRQRPAHLRRRRSACTGSTSRSARCTCSRSARSPSTGSCSAAGPRARSTRSSARCAARRS